MNPENKYIIFIPSFISYLLYYSIGVFIPIIVAIIFILTQSELNLVYLLFLLIIVITMLILSSIIAKKTLQTIEIILQNDEIIFIYKKQNEKIDKFKIKDIRSYYFTNNFNKSINLIFYDNTEYTIQYFWALERKDNYDEFIIEFEKIIKKIERQNSILNNKNSNKNYWDTASAGVLFALCVIGLIVYAVLFFYEKSNGVENFILPIVFIIFITIYLFKKYKIKATKR